MIFPIILCWHLAYGTRKEDPKMRIITYYSKVNKMDTLHIGFLRKTKIMKASLCQQWLLIFRSLEVEKCEIKGALPGR